MANTEAPDSGWVFVSVGVLFGAIGTGLLVALAGSGDDAANTVIALVGIILSTVGGILALIGSIAVGVTVGFRRADWRIRR